MSSSTLEKRINELEATLREQSRQLTRAVIAMNDLVIMCGKLLDDRLSSKTSRPQLATKHHSGCRIIKFQEQ